MSLKATDYSYFFTENEENYFLIHHPIHLHNLRKVSLSTSEPEIMFRHLLQVSQ